MKERNMKVLQLMESQIRTMIETAGTKDFLTALHNASVHGEVFEENEGHLLDDEDTFLSEWFKSIDALRNAFDKANK